MKLRNFVLIAAALMVAAGSYAKVPKEWTDRYAALMKTIKSMNLTAFKNTFADNFVLINKDGKTVKRAEFFRELDGMFTQAKAANGKVTLTNVTVSNSTTSVSFDFRLTIYYKNGTMLQAHEVGVDSWKQINGKWKFVKTVDSVFTTKTSRAAPSSSGG